MRGIRGSPHQLLGKARQVIQWLMDYLIQYSVYPTFPVSFVGRTKSRRSLLYGVYAMGSRISHTGGTYVTCSVLHNSDINHSCILAADWSVWNRHT